MRLSEWRAVAPARPPVDPKIMAIVEPVLGALGVGTDPHCWVVWGDDYLSRWQILVPSLPGLLVVFVRVNVAGEGPRASAKLVRWARVQVGELAVETQSGHRILSFTVENAILKGVDAEADRVAMFALGLLSAIDGRLTDVDAVFGKISTRGRTARGRAASPAGKSSAKKPAGAPASRTDGKAGAVRGKSASRGTEVKAIPAKTGAGATGTASSGPAAKARATATRSGRTRAG